jgi:prolyl-tRNA editing enzyme YbaK/EbsC (Cys-tRNA(Pro) deacylase)
VLTGPGILPWRPAADHPELLATPVARALPDVDCLVASIDPDLADTAAFCSAYEVDMAVSANCVVVEGRRGDATTHAACMVLATDRADVNKTIRKHLGVRKISFAAMDVATSLTGMEYGGITPIGLPEDWPILIDQAVPTAGVVVIGAGIRGAKIAISGADLAKLPHAEVLPLTQ